MLFLWQKADGVWGNRPVHPEHVTGARSSRYGSATRVVNMLCSVATSSF